MSRFYKIVIALTLICSPLLTGCATEEEQKMFAAQERMIEEIIKAQMDQHPEFILTSNDGIERLTVKKGEGAELGKKGMVEFYYAGYLLNRQGTIPKNLFNTNHEGLAKESGWVTDNENAFEIVRVSLEKDSLIKGLEKGLVGVQAGEECFILFTSENAFGEKKMNGIPINSGLIYHIWVEKVEN